jgi:hypothetical protein
LFSRLQAISNNGKTFYNIDGINIVSETYTNDLSEEGLKKPFRKYSINKEDIKVRDTGLPFNNYYVFKSVPALNNIDQYNSYYFIETKEKWLTIIYFASYKKPDKQFEREFVTLLYNENIPKYVFSTLVVDSINFAGRKIALGKSCNWMNINSVQCPYYGQMNWSVHKELPDAQNTVDIQHKLNNLKKGIKVLSENNVEVVFEGNATNATKVIYDFTGAKSLLAGMSGAKILTVYYLATGVRNNFVSCVLSFWNNDKINPGGLPPLLENVMKLK